MCFQMLSHLPRFSPNGISKAKAEIKSRHSFGYEVLTERIIQRIRDFYAQLPRLNEKGNVVEPKLIIGLSGGVDSSVVTYLAVRAIGAENVIPITISSRKNEECISLAEIVRHGLGITGLNYTRSIRKHTELFLEENPEADKIDLGNFASRVRVAILFFEARKHFGRVLGTGNRTEFVQGYATKYGTPNSCDFGILDDLYKTDVYELARVLGVPQEIIHQRPSTGFYEGQTHEEELGATWEEQDAAAFLLFEKKLSVEEIVEEYGASREYLETILRRYESSEHKRRLQSIHVELRGAE